MIDNAMNDFLAVAWDLATTAATVGLAVVALYAFLTFGFSRSK